MTHAEDLAVPERLLHWLADHDGATISVADLAMEIGCGEKTLERVMRDFRAAGIVSVERHADGRRGSRPSTYSFGGAGATTAILALLEERGTATVDEVADGCGITVAAARGGLWALRAAGQVERAAPRPGRWRRCVDACRVATGRSAEGERRRAERLPIGAAVVCLLSERGEVRMTKAELAREVGCCEKSLSRAMAELRAAGVVVSRENHTSTGANGANSYRLASDTPESVSEVTCRLAASAASPVELAASCELPLRVVRGALYLMLGAGAAKVQRLRTGSRGGSRVLYRLAS